MQSCCWLQNCRTDSPLRCCCCSHRRHRSSLHRSRMLSRAMKMPSFRKTFHHTRQERPSPDRHTIFVISIPHRVFTDRVLNFRQPACRSSGEGRWGNSYGDVPCHRTNAPTTARPNNAANASPHSSPSACDGSAPDPRSRTAQKIYRNCLGMALSFVRK